MSKKNYYTVSEVAEIVGSHDGEVHKDIRERNLRTVKKDGNTYISKEDLESYRKKTPNK